MTNLDERVAHSLRKVCPASYDGHRTILTQIILHNMAQRRRDAFAAAEEARALDEYCRRVCETFQANHVKIARLQEEKDPQAWQELLEQMYQWVLSILRKQASQVHHISLLEWGWEITHLAGLALASARYPYDCQFEAWAYTIVRHTTLNEIRRHLTLQAQLENRAETFGDLTDIDFQLKELYQITPLFMDDHEALKEGLLQLPDVQRLVIIMHYFEDYSLSEIAKILEKSPNAVYQAHFHGLKKLRQLLSD